MVEPTVSGIHGFERVVKLADDFDTTALACVNMCDINEEVTCKIEGLAARLGVEAVGRIPYDDAVVKAQLCRTRVVENTRGGAGLATGELWSQVLARFDSGAVQRRDERVVE
ncbi:MAG: hypothetical protein JXQ75_04155 [Phycisphaerae bacterium]|nr:hypothetical protein [Phycisphaerae bacterium]